MNSTSTTYKLIAPLLLGSLLLISTLIKLDAYESTLGGAQENVSALSLIPLSIWAAEGATTHSFAPVQSFPGEENIGVTNSGMRTTAASGKSYYTSAPPFSLILAHTISSLTGTAVTPNFLKLLLHTGHCLTATLLYILLLPFSLFAAFAATALYLLTALNLWYLGNCYSWDTVWLFFWMVTLFFLSRAQQQQPFSKEKSQLWLIASIFQFLACYTDFQTVFFLPALFGTLLILGIKIEKKNLLIFSVATFSAIIITMLQYGSVVGISSYLDSLLHQGKGRSLIGFPVAESLTIVDHYLYHLALPLLVTACILVYLLFKKRIHRSTLPTHLTLIIVSSFLFVLLHNILFPGWTKEHEYSLIKIIVPLALLLGVSFSLFITTTGLPRNISFTVSVVVLLILCFNQLQIYQSHFEPGIENRRALELGTKIQQSTLPGETVMAISDFYLWSPILYYAGHNIQGVKNREEAVTWLSSHQRRKAVLFTIDAAGSIVSLEHLR